MNKTMRKAIIFGTIWALAISVGLGAKYVKKNLPAVSYITGTTDGHWTDTGSDIRPTTTTYAVRIIGNLTCEDVFFEDITTTGNLLMSSGNKIVQPDGATSAPKVITYKAWQVYTPDFGSSSVTCTTYSVTNTKAYGHSTATFNTPVPSRVGAAKVVLDRVTIFSSGVDNANKLNFEMWRSRQGNDAVKVASQYAINTDNKQALGSDVAVMDGYGYWIKLRWICSDSQPDASVGGFKFEYHTVNQ